MTIEKHVTIVHDNSVQNKTFHELVKRYNNIRLVDVNSFCADDLTHSLSIIVQINMNDPGSLRPLKIKMAMPERKPIPVLFLINQFNRREVVQANILGATDYMIYPCPDDSFIKSMGDLVNRKVEKAWSKLSTTQ